MAAPNEVLKEALTLKPAQKAELIDKLLSSLDKPDADIDELWAKEVESRIAAYEQGKINAVALDKVLEKYKWDKACGFASWKLPRSSCMRPSSITIVKYLDLARNFCLKS